MEGMQINLLHGVLVRKCVKGHQCYYLMVRKGGNGKDGVRARIKKMKLLLSPRRSRNSDRC
jgi:hypothetical protein